MAQNRSSIDESSIQLETVRCGLCGNDDPSLLLKAANIKQRCKREYNVVRCGKCGLAFLSPRPSRESLLKYYLEDDPEKTERKPAFYEKLYFNIFRKIPLRRKGSLLDVGCGSGRYIYVLKALGWDVKGIDIGYTGYGRDVLGLDIREGDLVDAHFKPESFDAITFWWTLEHMYDPSSVLKEAYRLLKKGGVAVIGVQNIDSLEARLFKRYWFHLFLPKHLYHFSPKSLTAILKKSEFGKVKIRHDLFSFGTIGSLQCFLNAHGINVSFTNPLFYALSLPIDAVLGMMKNSGLITAYAYKE
ncbi:MAG: class I SAM-dependent methyltransferase [Candidatus Omnitrophica bacterium]|nr:class I SAM-dependent methyltransferase [Candidatus Omnitrophota bacterium]